MKDEIKRGRELLPKIIVVMECSWVMIYVTDSDILGAIPLMLLAEIMIDQRKRIWTADWTPRETETKDAGRSKDGNH
ncbi:hypothetical protein HB780_01600 (plasmid) [Rhizobium lusitanum]|uniref:hypothetical protein n=1 Tax=Rhizobium lusitanum TaxID=293958 RepID=UPI00161F2F83|nr:hypothetical protein [Rhizobium lusitanum]QND44509.1 hypothetical protein HB780_01600 [Rhizobium lusitanum]